VSDPNKLRELAAWYRDFAERAGSPWIWEARLRRAEDLEAEARRIEPGDDRQIAVSPRRLLTSAGTNVGSRQPRQSSRGLKIP
jgi:hypothetical protein